MKAEAKKRAGSEPKTAASRLPEVTVIERTGSDEDGVGLARPVVWPGPEPGPVLRLVETGTEASLAIGERAAARLVALESGAIEARVIRRLEPAGKRIIGTFRSTTDGGRLAPSDRRDRNEYRVAAGDTAGADDGELIVAEQFAARRFGAPRARVVERLGAASDAGAVSRLVIASYDIPTEFPATAMAEAEAAAALELSLADRADLRDVPLVTIDGSDARDFDDAVWAEPDPDPENRGGWHLVVAIADVAYYVRPGGALDREAERRGNSVYFPDRVVPMLPETLSNELCSLKPQMDRACLAVHLWIDAEGRKRRHRFERALMRSAARLTYDEAQAAREGRRPCRLPADALTGLYGAYAALANARVRRGALELDLSEDWVTLDGAGKPATMVRAVRLDSHRLIEEFMILANVAAAEELEAQRQPCIYRVHDAPDPEKVRALREFLDEMGVPGLVLAKGQALKPELFNRVLRRAEGTPEAPLVNDLVLRCQAQAAYSPDNIGHFGLALRRYAHFTSPIRRYADLLVHRVLLGALGGSSPAVDASLLGEIADHISATERRATEAERAALDRYRAILLASSVGGLFPGYVSGVVSFGLFVTLPDTGANGLVPISSLPDDYYRFDEPAHRLVGRASGRIYRLGDEVTVRLVEADGWGGRLVLRIEAGGFRTARDAPKRSRVGHRPPFRGGRPGRRR
jgi:ribonuclease R